jgi:hypothetical protein
MNVDNNSVSDNLTNIDGQTDLSAGLTTLIQQAGNNEHGEALSNLTEDPPFMDLLTVKNCTELGFHFIITEIFFHIGNILEMNKQFMRMQVYGNAIGVNLQSFLNFPDFRDRVGEVFIVDSLTVKGKKYLKFYDFSKCCVALSVYLLNLVNDFYAIQQAFDGCIEGYSYLSMQGESVYFTGAVRSAWDAIKEP